MQIMSKYQEGPLHLQRTLQDPRLRKVSSKRRHGALAPVWTRPDVILIWTHIPRPLQYIYWLQLIACTCATRIGVALASITRDARQMMLAQLIGLMLKELGIKISISL